LSDGTTLRFRHIGGFTLVVLDNCEIDTNGFIRCQVEKEVSVAQRGPASPQQNSNEMTLDSKGKIGI
jgi:hypothetical protein